MCFLKKLSQNDYYGCTLMQEMRKVFIDVNAILRRLKKEGKAETYFGEKSNGPQRKYCRITEAGICDLVSTVKDWKAQQEIVKQMGIE